MPAGTYQVKVRKTGRAITGFTEVSVESEGETFKRLSLPAEARLAVTVTEPGVGRVPAKVTLVGVSPEDTIGQDTKTFLFDLSLGEAWRFSDLVPDTENASTRQFIEAFQHAPHGQVTMAARTFSGWKKMRSRGPARMAHFPCHSSAPGRGQAADTPSAVSARAFAPLPHSSAS